MSLSAILTLVIIFAVITFFVAKIKEIDKKQEVIHFAKNRCASQIALLLNKERITKKHKFSSEEEDIICSLNLEAWKHWESQTIEAKECAKKFPLAFDDFTIESFPEVYNRKGVEKDSSVSLEKIRNSVVDAMTIEELSLLLAETSDNWNARVRRNNVASEIKRLYSVGYRTYCEVMKKPSLSTTEIVRNKKAIIEYQKVYERSKVYDAWEEKQSNFSSSYHALCRELRNNDGRLSYQIKFNFFDKFGRLKGSEFTVWQGFVDAFSFSDIAEKPEFMTRCQDNLPFFQKRTKSFVDSVYNGIYDIIESINGKEVNGTLVVFVNSSMYNWDKFSYDYHYCFLKSKLADNNIDFCDLECIKDIDRKNVYSSAIIVDFITNDEDLKNNCRIVSEYFTCNVPFIGYYTLIKEFTVDQLKLHYKKEEKSPTSNSNTDLVHPENDDNEIAFIQDLFEKVNKHSFFSYIAITNTLIGNANGADKTRREWLDNPNKYHFKTENSDDIITGKYSIDGGLSYKSFSMQGDRRNLKDTAKYTFYLFKEMRVWDQFKKRGSDAIDYMNNMSFLRYH